MSLLLSHASPLPLLIPALVACSYNGNPWYLTTLAPAEQMYRAVSIWNQFGSITITTTSLPFFKNLVSTATVGTYKKGDGNFEKVTAAVSAYADGL